MANCEISRCYMILWQGQVFSMVFCQGNWQGHLPSFGKGIFLMRHCEVTWLPWLISGNQMSPNLKMFAVINKTRKIDTWDETFHHLLFGASWSSSVDASVTDRGYHKLQFQRGTWWSSMAGCGVPHFSDKPRLFVSSCLHASVWYTQLLLFPEKFFPTDNFGLVQPIKPDLYFLVYDIASQTFASSKGFIWASVSASSLGMNGSHTFWQAPFQRNGAISTVFSSLASPLV